MKRCLICYQEFEGAGAFCSPTCEREYAGADDYYDLDDYDCPEPDNCNPPDESMDGDHETGLRDAGWGTDEDYGCF